MKNLVLLLAVLFSFSAFAGFKDTFKKEKAKLEEQLNKGLDSADREIDRLKEKAKTAQGAVKADMESQIENLEKDKEAAKEKMNKVKGSSKSAWEEIKVGAKDAYESLKNSVSKAADKFKD